MINNILNVIYWNDDRYPIIPVKMLFLLLVCILEGMLAMKPLGEVLKLYTSNPKLTGAFGEVFGKGLTATDKF
jgi:hypothetical protein